MKDLYSAMQLEDAEELQRTASSNLVVFIAVVVVIVGGECSVVVARPSVVVVVRGRRPVIGSCGRAGPDIISTRLPATLLRLGGVLLLPLVLRLLPVVLAIVVVLHLPCVRISRRSRRARQVVMLLLVAVCFAASPRLLQHRHRPLYCAKCHASREACQGAKAPEIDKLGRWTVGCSTVE